MSLEIERKFLVDLNKLGNLANGIEIKQGYINTADNTVVRVRIKGKKAYLTIKGENKVATRLEFEYEIPYKDGIEMLE
jgi:adenylate cyclase